jgi:hypothetical protein
MSSTRKPNRSAEEIAEEKVEKARKKQEREERQKEKQEKDQEKKTEQSKKKQERDLKKQAVLQEHGRKQEIEIMRIQDIETSRQQILLTYPKLQELVHLLQKWDWNTCFTRIKGVSHLSSNMFRFFQAMIVERSIALAAPADEPASWIADELDTGGDIRTFQNHQVEVKACTRMFVKKNGDTNPITIKNARGSGSTLRNLAPDIRKDDVFLLVQKHAPYAVALCLPDDISFKVGEQESTMRGFENTEVWDQNIGAELTGYVKPENYVWIVSPGSIDPLPPKFNYDPDEMGINYYLKNCI